MLFVYLVGPIDVFVDMGRYTALNHNDWRLPIVLYLYLTAFTCIINSNKVKRFSNLSFLMIQPRMNASVPKWQISAGYFLIFFFMKLYLPLIQYILLKNHSIGRYLFCKFDQ